MSSQNKQNYLLTPQSLFACNKFSLAEKVVLARAMSFGNHRYYESVEKTALFLGISESVVEKARAKFIKLGYFKKVGYSNNRVVYEVCDDIIEKDCQVRRITKNDISFCPEQSQNMQFEIADCAISQNDTYIYNNKEDNRVLDDDEKDIEDDDDTDVAFEGALVGNPILNSNVGMTLYGHQSNSVFEYSIDMDMGAFYPSTVISHNIAACCLYFKAFCSHKQFEYNGGKLKFNGYTNIPIIKTNDTLLDDDVAKELFDNFQTGNYISFGHKWMNLPSISDIYNKYLKEGK